MARRYHAPSMQIRLAEATDNEALRSIYNSEVLGGLNTFDLVPRTPEEQRAWFNAHQSAHPAIVAVSLPGSAEANVGARGEPVLGFGVLSPYRNRPAYSTTAEDSLYVDPRHRGSGVGKELLKELLRIATDHGFHTVVARIVGHNEVSIGLHQKCGFELVGVEREVGRKHGRWLDVVELQRML